MIVKSTQFIVQLKIFIFKFFFDKIYYLKFDSRNLRLYSFLKKRLYSNKYYTLDQ